MTIYQRQCLLAYLGFYTGAIDGIWGEKSKEAAKAFQRAYGLVVDGVVGPVTEKALRGAVAGTMESIPNYQPPNTGTTEPNTSGQPPDTGTFWDGIKYFTREEFRCPCGKCGGFPVEPQEALVRTVNSIREELGVPVIIVPPDGHSGGSGVRCADYNEEIGGVSNSQHLYGKAADLHSKATPAQMKAAAENVMGNTGGIGLYSWGIHVDVRNGYSRWNG